MARAFPLGAALVLAGCVAAPALPPRQAPLAAPARFAQGGSAQADLARWWQGWGDPALNRLVEQALAANADLRAARAHVAAARALAAVSEGALYPTVAAGGTVWTGWSDAEVDAPVGSLLGPYGTGNNPQARAIGLGASWEPDLFGGRHADAAAARAAAASAGFAAEGLRVLVAGDVVENYQQVQGLRQRLALLDRSLAEARALADYAAVRMAAGQANAADLSKARGALEQLAAQRAPLEALIDARRRRLAVLAGLAPETPVELGDPALLVVPPAPDGGLPSAVLARRPDVRARAALVEAHAARLKSLKADLMPHFSIQFMGQSGRIELSGLPGYGGNAALVGLSASVPVFTGGRLRARVAGGDAELTAALAAQDKAMLAALEEVEAAYGFRHALDGKVAALEAAADQTAARARQQEAFYQAARATRGDVLQARLADLEARDALIQARMARASAGVQLARALGGGWQP